MADGNDYEARLSSFERQIALLERSVEEHIGSGDVEAWIAASASDAVARLRRRRVAALVSRTLDLPFVLGEQITLGGRARITWRKATPGPDRDRAVDLGEMYQAGQITLAEMNAGEHIKRLFDRIALYEGGGSVLGRLDRVGGGGNDFDLITAQRMDAVRAWVELQADIKDNERASQHEGERAQWAAVLEAVLRDGMTFQAAAKKLGNGKRDVIRKRFKRALGASADALGMGGVRDRMRWARDADAVPVVMGEE